MTPEEIQNSVLYRDALILVINKPAGIPVHAGPKGGENLEQYFDALKFESERAPGLAHRLDRDTSGCLILGRNHKALSKLGKLFQGGRIKKTYWAIVEGTPREESGRIDLPLAKKSKDKRSWHMIVDKENGQPTITDYKIIGKYNNFTWLELKPQTGRTHQLRVHCMAIGCPILGDAIYGTEKDKKTDTKLQLHARSIEIPLGQNKDPIIVDAPPPAHMNEMLLNFNQ